jgi:hypothetical protein
MQGNGAGVIGRAGAATLVAMATVGVLAAAGFSAARSTPEAAPDGAHWAMARSSLEHLVEADETGAARALNSPRTLVQGEVPMSTDPNPSGWSTTSTARWASYAGFAADVAAGQVPGYVKVAHYDNESWEQTPVAEQRHPAAFERRFCATAHAHGWRCLAGPGQDLCGVLAHPHGDNYAHCYLDLELARKAARFADVVDIQAQSLEPRGCRVYANFLRRAGAQARAGNPDVTVLANLSVSPSGHRVGSAQLYRCARAALPFVDGFYLTVAAGEGAEMMTVLSRLGEAIS